MNLKGGFSTNDPRDDMAYLLSVQGDALAPVGRRRTP